MRKKVGALVGLCQVRSVKVRLVGGMCGVVCQSGCVGERGQVFIKFVSGQVSCG